MATITTSSVHDAGRQENQSSKDGAPRLYRLSVDQYERMAEAGILGEEDPVELIAGVLVKKMVKSPPHVVSAKKTLRELESLVPAGWHVAKEDPIRIPSRDSEPEPDLAVIRGKPEDYIEKNPDVSAVALVVEVAESSLDFDRNDKLAIYGRGGIPAYWIVNLTDWQVEVCSEPSGAEEPPGYRQCHVFGSDSQVDLIIEGSVVGRITVRDLLP